MPSRKTATVLLAKLFNVLAHADRVRIIEELNQRDCDVQTLAEVLGAGQSRVSQQLSLLKLHNIVSDKRDGRRVIYHLRDPKLALWILDGLNIIEHDLDEKSELKIELERAREQWQHPQD